MVKVLLVEDDHLEARRIAASIQSNFQISELRPVRTEYEFRESFDSIVRFAPDLVVMDLMLRWTDPGARMVPAPLEVKAAEYRLGGLRCCRRLLAQESTAGVPVILYSALDQRSIDEARAEMPDNVFTIRKDRDEATLVRLIRSVMQTHGNLRMDLDSVFIVHGHDGESKEMVARFVERLGLRAVILQEQVNRGQTIIEKFEQESNVAFAIVILTPDDVGSKATQSGSLAPRASQNVIFELASFWPNSAEATLVLCLRAE